MFIGWYCQDDETLACQKSSMSFHVFNIHKGYYTTGSPRSMSMQINAEQNSGIDPNANTIEHYLEIPIDWN